MKLRIFKLCVMFMVMLTVPLLVFPGNVSFTKVSEWGTGDYEAVAVKGNYAFCATASVGMDVIDISNPSNPVRVDGIDMTGDKVYSLRSIAISGNYAYLGDYYSGIYVVDISNPSNPVFKQQVSQGYTALNLTVYNNLLLVNSSTRFLIYNISNPASPVNVGTYVVNEYIGSFAVSGNYAFLRINDEMRVIDISNPAAPSLVYTYHTDSGISSIAVSGNYLYLTSYTTSGGKWVILDITDPKLPVFVKEKVLSNSYMMIIKGRYAYFLSYQTGASGLNVADLIDPTDPIVVGSLGFSLYPNDIRVSGDKLFLADYEGGFVIADISSPTTPTRIGYLNKAAMFNSIVMSNQYAYLSGHHFKVFDISNPSAPSLKGSLYYGGLAKHISGNYVFAMSGGFNVFDVSNPSAPKSVYSTGRYEYDETYDMSVSGDYLFLSDGDEGFDIYDVSDPTHPVFGGINIPDNLGYYIFSDAKGKYLYVETTEKLYIYDISHPPNAIRLSSIDIDGVDVFVDSTLEYLYITSGAGIKIIDIADPADPAQVGSIDIISTNISKIYGDGNYIYVGTWYNGLFVYDISTPSLPVLAGRWTGVSGIGDFAVQGNYMYVAGGNGGKFYILRMDKTQGAGITVTSPNGGEIWKTGSTHTITWTSQNMTGTVNIAIYKGNNLYSSLGSANVTAGTFSWNIPTNLPGANNYKIRVYQNGGNVGDYSNMNFSIDLPTQIYLNRSSLYFKSIDGIQTSPQTVTIRNSGGGVLNWTASANQPWIQVTPNSGTGNKNILVSVQPSGLSSGNYPGIITISDPGAINSPQTIEVTLTVADSGSVPFGEISSPIDGSTVSGSIPVTGWALDDIEVTSVKIYRDSVSGEPAGWVYIGDAVFVDDCRSDVEVAYPNFPFNYRAGWGYMLLTNMLPNSGNGSFTLYANATDREGNTITLGSKTIICDNVHAVKPFGAIDTPLQGGSVSGSSYLNFGWALTPLPNMIPINGSTISIWIDGVSVGHPGYNQYREDIAGLFPGLNNSNGAGGYFYFDSAKYDDGVHTIAWTVKDNAENEDGIGSRYFTINNNVGLSGAPDIGLRYGLVTQPPSDESDIENIEIDQLERVEISIPGCVGGNLIVGDQRKPLPIGSTLDTNQGVFYWQPGPGFIGTYRLEFIVNDSNGAIKTKVIIIHINSGYEPNKWISQKNVELK